MTNNSLNTTNNIFKELSIQIAMNGLSFSVRNSANKEILDFKDYPLLGNQNELELQETIADAFVNTSFLADKFDSVLVNHINNKAVFVPNTLFEADNAVDYLKFSVSLEEQSHIATDDVPSIQAKLVFVPYTRINNFLFEKLGTFDFTHHSKKLLQYFLNKNPQNSIKNTFLFFRANTFDCFILQNGKLLFYNSFSFQNEADVLYFLLFTFEQYKLNQEHNPLFISGDLKQDAIIFDALKKYFKQLEMLKVATQLSNTQYSLNKLAPIL